MQRAGLGHWFGLATTVDGFSRLQFVSTHPAWRRRGLCIALVHAACRHGFEEMDLRTLVMVAGSADVAIGVYESPGFRRGGGTCQFERPPR
jgi:ribosomal protein S18 acetylase RimI-like enzyme